MGLDKEQEAFIPIRRSDLIALCLQDGRLDGEAAEQFRQLCQILTAYYHYRSQVTLEVVKDAFAPFNPDRDTRPLRECSGQELAQAEQQLVRAFEQVLRQANYTPLSHDALQAALQSHSLLPVRGSVNFDDYERVICYRRGLTVGSHTAKRWLRRVEHRIPMLQRVALLLKFKDEAHFRARGAKLDELSFKPGKLYLYLYKNIPRADLELLFPNVKIRMSWKDRLLFGIPALGAAVPLLLKVLPSLGLIVGALLLVLLGPEIASTMVPQVQGSAQLYTVLVATLSVGMTLGGFAVRQYNGYKNKRLKFLKQVTETLFFKNLVTNQGVLHTLVDAANEEECKEVILVAYHLLTARRSLTLAELDAAIERWTQERLGERVNFDIAKTVQHMAQLSAPAGWRATPQRQSLPQQLLHIDAQGHCRMLPLDQALVLLDYVWDHVFDYANSAVTELAATYGTGNPPGAP